MKYPSPQTLRKYGLSKEEWLALYNGQGGRCAICEMQPSTGRLCVDHFHVRGWKKMPPEKRKTYVRGLLCWTCNNKILTRGVTIEKLRSAADYLERYEKEKK